MYNYQEAIKDDIRSYISEHNVIVKSDERDEIQDTLYEDMWISDQVTGNASGSYTFNRWKAEEYLCHNTDLLLEAIEEFGGEYKKCLECAETADVTIRCYLLSQCLSEVLDELEVEDNEDEESAYQE